MKRTNRAGRSKGCPDDAERILGAMVSSEAAAGRLGGPWRHEVTPVVKYCGVVVAGKRPVLLVNPTWLRELLARDELDLLADEMRTWFAIHNEVADRLRPRSAEDTCSAA